MQIGDVWHFDETPCVVALILTPYEGFDERAWIMVVFGENDYEVTDRTRTHMEEKGGMWHEAEKCPKL